MSPTSFVLKTLEGVLNIHLRAIRKTMPFSKSQQADFNEKPTETAFHEVVSAVKRPLNCRQYTLVVFSNPKIRIIQSELGSCEQKDTPSCVNQNDTNAIHH